MTATHGQAMLAARVGKGWSKGWGERGAEHVLGVPPVLLGLSLAGTASYWLPLLPL